MTEPTPAPGLRLVRQDVATAAALVALLFAILAVLLESVFNVPLKLPGHRALPGALAVLLFAEVLAPVALLLVAAAVPAALWLLGVGPLGLLVAWLGTAITLVGLQRTRLGFLVAAASRRAQPARRRSGRTLPAFVLLGLLFGLLRYLALAARWHHTAELVRLGGHLCFGGVGGLIAFAGSRAVTRASERAR
jgi:hypothetical protein